MRICVLGGTGVISRAVVQAGIYRGHDMTIVNRGKRNVSFKGSVRTIIADKTDRDAFAKTMAGECFDAVIDMICYDENDAKHTVDVFKDKAKRLLFTSSSAAYEKPFRSMPVREQYETLTTSPDFLYGFKKANMERYLNTVMQNGPIAVTIIRPSLTFGEGCANLGVLRQNANIVRRILEGKRLVVPGDGTAPWAFTFAPDMGRAYIMALETSATLNKTYHVCNTENTMFKDLYLTAGKVLGKEVRLAYLPTEVLYAKDPETFGHFYHEKQYATLFSTEKFQSDVPEFKVEINLEKGLAHMIQWWKETNYPFDEAKDKAEDELVALYESMLG
ncbi:MAG: NAD-dependent epimerase/dehydratase family protein [Sphaerochaetaceae bacterium]|nr:NAD-dependent epimerase/dehydratase family protein [Sphaerochaetaceae bacterium]